MKEMKKMRKEIIVEDVIEICNGKLVCGDPETTLKEFKTDTRKVNLGDVYVAIKGENHNGNEFYEEALRNGASVCILQDIIIPENVIQKYQGRSIIIVENTVRALQKLAKYKRSMYDIPAIAITGSVGKTSTKDIIASVMSKEFNVLKTEGNLNSQVGTALTVLKLKETHTAMVIEMGMSSLGEISNLTDIVKPTVAVITNVGTAHIGILGSRANILKAKLEILEALQSDGKVVINNDNDLLHEWYLNSGSEYDIITYGMENISNIMPYNMMINENGSIYNIDVEGKKHEVKIKIAGSHFISNSLCAIAVGRIFNINMKKIIEGIYDFELTKRRMQIEKTNNNIMIINDCYNANYDSMKAAIEYLGKLKTKKIAILGDMLELGEYSEDLHRKVGKEVASNNIDILITVGKEAKFIANEAINYGMNCKNIYAYNSKEEAEEKIEELSKEENINILIKASLGMNFQEIYENIIKKIKENNG